MAAAKKPNHENTKVRKHEKSRFLNLIRIGRSRIAWSLFGGFFVLSYFRVFVISFSSPVLTTITASPLAAVGATACVLGGNVSRLLL